MLSPKLLFIGKIVSSSYKLIFSLLYFQKLRTLQINMAEPANSPEKVDFFGLYISQVSLGTTAMS